jgi:uncharacterized Zn-binding protein involved in type VI secretion
MAGKLILIGDKTSHGGTVIGSSAESSVGGVRIARMGDKVTCPIPFHGGTCPIVTGDPTMMIDGMPAARAGDKTACGAQLIPSQGLTTDLC